MNTEFDGKLKKEETERLIKAGISEKHIRQIERFLEKYKEYLTGFEDIVGDDEIPTRLFWFSLKHTGKLLDGDAEKVLSPFGIKMRGLTTARLVRLLGANFMTSRQIFEDRNRLRGEADRDKKIELPKEPVIWASNHHFADDALASLRAVQRPVTVMFGSLPLYFNTTNGVMAYLIGSILINRKNKNSKRASLPKAKRAIELGSDLLWYPEATHNKTSEKPVLDLWNGIYRTACETGVKIVPIVHYIFDPTQSIVPHKLNPIHTVVDDPIDLTGFSEKAGLEYLRDVMATWYYLMLERYGKMKREELVKSYEKRAIAYGLSQEEFLLRPITFTEIGELYNRDLRKTVFGYDRNAEMHAAYLPKTYARPEDVYESIAGIKHSTADNVWNILEASRLVDERKAENFQGRF